MSFEKSVFINCPFDEDYWDLFRPMVFTTLRLGCQPRYSLERADSSEARIGKIISLIGQCKFGIHDLSRCKSNHEGEFFRLNIPLELGLDLGAKAYGPAKLQQKKILILEEERYRFQAAISGISNSDIMAHDKDPDRLVRIVRNWLVQEAGTTPLSPTQIWYEYSDCLAESYDQLRAEGYSHEDVNELMQRMTTWIKNLHPKN